MYYYVNNTTLCVGEILDEFNTREIITPDGHTVIINNSLLRMVRQKTKDIIDVSFVFKNQSDAVDIILKNLEAEKIKIIYRMLKEKSELGQIYYAVHENTVYPFCTPERKHFSDSSIFDSAEKAVYSLL